ncbi:MAG: hypothetical protein IPL28_03370 [Chloroflexi bacterium]|nr:hypothetical protein [Chloroflexota bacterium]
MPHNVVSVTAAPTWPLLQLGRDTAAHPSNGLSQNKLTPSAMLAQAPTLMSITKQPAV